MLGFDGIAAGGVLVWLMDCLDEKLLDPDRIGVAMTPKWHFQDFDVVKDSMQNAKLGKRLLDEMVRPDGKVPLKKGARKLARGLAREKRNPLMDRFVHNAFARQGWMVPNQYWTLGVLAPMKSSGNFRSDGVRRSFSGKES